MLLFDLAVALAPSPSPAPAPGTATGSSSPIAEIVVAVVTAISGLIGAWLLKKRRDGESGPALTESDVQVRERVAKLETRVDACERINESQGEEISMFRSIAHTVEAWERSGRNPERRRAPKRSTE